MFSYPVLTGNAAIDDHIFSKMHKDATAQNLSTAETQHCLVTFARHMLQMLANRKSSGRTIAGTEFVRWLEAAAEDHLLHFLGTYHAVGTDIRQVFGSHDEIVIPRRISSKEEEIGCGPADEIMLSDDDGILAAAACQLSASARVIVLWHYFGGITVREIADKVGISESKVRARIVRATREMHMVLARHCHAAAAASMAHSDSLYSSAAAMPA